LKGKRELPAFLASCGIIVGLLATVAAGQYPNLLTSSLNPQFNLDVQNAAAGSAGLRIGLGWWILALIAAIGYFIYLFYLFRGKVEASSEGHGY
jgi:cytochrome d ubiquinol oxidase subunit II